MFSIVTAVMKDVSPYVDVNTELVPCLSKEPIIPPKPTHVISLIKFLNMSEPLHQPKYQSVSGSQCTKHSGYLIEKI